MSTMPTIQMLYDDSVISEKEIKELGLFLRELCLNSKNLNVKASFAYAENPKIKVNLFPIEIYIKITRSKILNQGALLKEIENGLRHWKVSKEFPHPINILLMPMDWEILGPI